MSLLWLYWCSPVKQIKKYYPRECHQKFGQTLILVDQIVSPSYQNYTKPIGFHCSGILIQSRETKRFACQIKKKQKNRPMQNRKLNGPFFPLLKETTGTFFNFLGMELYIKWRSWRKKKWSKEKLTALTIWFKCSRSLQNESLLLDNSDIGITKARTSIGRSVTWAKLLSNNQQSRLNYEKR